MKINWFTDDFNYNRFILSGDVGGTNTNLAIIGETNNNFNIIVELQINSREINGILQPVNELIQSAAKKNNCLLPSLCCISAAGPVEKNRCKLTNCNWEINGDSIKSETGLDTLIINDFLAISYSIPILDIDNPKQVTKIPHLDKSIPESQESVKIVTGPGTGLGVSYLIPYNGSYLPFPSEGGHSDFASFNEETKNLKDHVTRKKGMKKIGVEPFLSGQGLVNIFNYFVEAKSIKFDNSITDINLAPDEKKPPLISKYSKINEDCMKMMELFISILGNFAGNLGTIFLPFGGIYIAGGISMENEELFLKNNLFMNAFEKNYKPGIENILKKIPVYLIRDYSVSLYGAANAAVNLMNDQSSP